MTLSTISLLAEAKAEVGAKEFTRQMPDGIDVCKTIEGLNSIQNPDVALAIWRRSPPLCLRSWLEQLAPPALPDLRLLIRPADLHRAMQPLLEEAGMPGGSMRDLLLDDIDTLVQQYADIVGTELIDVRFERISHDACWKFHRDSVETRLLTTYRGSATEWVHPSQSEAALSEQKEFMGPIERLAVHDVAIFRGSSAGPGRGIVHRSPPIAGTGETRLLLCLNTPSMSSPKQWPAPV